LKSDPCAAARFMIHRLPIPAARRLASAYFLGAGVGVTFFTGGALLISSFIEGGS
jgi:hypothetical protein